MIKNTAFRYVDEHTEGNVPVEITEGPFTGFQFRFDGVYFEEKNNELHFNYDYDIVRNDENFDENDEELKKVMNDILFQVLEEQMSLVGEDEELLKEGDVKES
tara:strand:- start:2586 stop:2894 length:309 start_codon:yes stop_codon:yes gene_type:complete